MPSSSNGIDYLKWNDPRTKTAKKPPPKPWPLPEFSVRGKVMAGGFSIELMRIGCIGILNESLRIPGEAPEGSRIVAMSLSEHMLSSTYGACEQQALRRAHADIYWEVLWHLTFSPLQIDN
jgi:hypothetical protein